MPPAPSQLAYIPFVSVENMMRLVHSFGIEKLLLELTNAVEAAYDQFLQRQLGGDTHIKFGLVHVMESYERPG